MNWMLAKKADVDRIYLPCHESGKRIQSHNDRNTDIHDKQG